VNAPPLEPDNRTSPRSKARNAPSGASPFTVKAEPLARAKFSDPDRTAKGETRASVPMLGLDTLWFNTGTLCNLACANCYIESSPTNDALVYLKAEHVTRYLDEIEADKLGTREIGFTGGEPFMNPEFPAMLTEVLERGFEALVLSNAMKPMRRHEAALLELQKRFGEKLTMRISLDHFTKQVHEAERGAGSWDAAIAGLQWLSEHGFSLAVAGRMLPEEDDARSRAGFAKMFSSAGIAVDAADLARLVIFPEMDAEKDIAEITTDCWDILGKRPDDIMCASSRMVVHRKGEADPRVAACTLLPYAPEFDLGASLAEASGAVKLNHPHCARFCVLGGASCAA
jgi:uncharacterized Fe-S cluster-containing radical SAM superfamily protein